MTSYSDSDLKNSAFYFFDHRAHNAIDKILQQTTGDIPLDEKTIKAMHTAVEALVKAQLLRKAHLDSLA